ncbi:MAG: tRNA uridine-5-carboxymethylaminomethyl(34) synthesis GTPase MnmE [Deltaproteobacteria bacterium]|nr:tRNA uridine-5-carboxymethylaminomethyl(34) synthesis GTPase MnmE [Deltaproteobacteria bacterium]
MSKHINKRDTEDTIVAIATATGEAGICVIRISGVSATDTLRKIFHPKSRTLDNPFLDRTMVYGWIIDGKQQIDEGFACVMYGPRSFTGEDVVEIHCHGGIFVSEMVLKAAMKNGSRMAEPGEFTQRAFLNGRIDLTKAEAIHDIIKATGKYGLEIAVHQLKGKLYKKIISLKENLTQILSLINAEIEFGEEEISLPQKNIISTKISELRKEIEEMIFSAERGIQLKGGYNVVIAGEPNAGKSSLLNGLLESSRAIVTDIPGTTRDTIEESFNLDGIMVSLTDTAGIRKTNDQLEIKGIERTRDALKKADLICWVIDLSSPAFELFEVEKLDLNPVKILLVLNKSDLIKGDISLPTNLNGYNQIKLSAHNKKDIDRLRSRLFEIAFQGDKTIVEDSFITNLRQKSAAENALESIKVSQDIHFNNLGEELLAQELSNALDSLKSIVGETTPDEILNHIFSNFCIGK